MSFLDNPSQKQIEFLDRYADRTVSTGCDYYHLKLGGISYDFTLHVENDEQWITGTYEDLELLREINT